MPLWYHADTGAAAHRSDYAQRMHRSRVGVILIDHPQESYAASSAFWAGAHGGSVTSAPSADDPYESLDDLPGGIKVEAQRTGSGTPPRIHLDIETDDVPAEVDRVIALGARVVEQHRAYAVLADPGGMQFCVVPVQTGAAFEEHATTWH